MKRNYVGLGTSPHDPSIAIVDERGTIVFAEGCERYLQNKRAWGSLPDDFVRIQSLIREYCSADADLVIASSWHKKFFQIVRFAALALKQPTEWPVIERDQDHPLVVVGQEEDQHDRAVVLDVEDFAGCGLARLSHDLVLLTLTCTPRLHRTTVVVTPPTG